MTDHILFRLRALPFLLSLGLLVIAGPENGFADDIGNPAKPLVVVELFTSQGCLSCPPADDFLKDLSARDDVLALSMHVDYWDYIGWKDPFAKPRFTNRQRQYASLMTLRYVYTPQMVINGVYQTVGSRRDEVLGFIEKAKTEMKSVPVAIDLARENGALRVRLQKLDMPDTPDTIDVYAVFYDKLHSTAVGRGENSGRKIINANVVRDLQRIAEWDGQDFNVSVRSDRDNKSDVAAVFLQARKSGRIIAAARLEL